MFRHTLRDNLLSNWKMSKLFNIIEFKEHLVRHNWDNEEIVVYLTFLFQRF